MLVTSLSTLEETRRFPPGLPSSLHWESYSQAWTDSPLAHWLLNSTIVSVTCVVSNLVLCSLAGYAFARIPFAGSRILFLGILATLMVPFQVVMIPTLLIVKQLGLVDSLPALIVPNLVTPFGIYLLRQFFLSLPAELEEAAIIDGAGRLRILFSILLPLMGPPLSTRRRPHLPPGLERLPLAAGGHLLPRDDDRAARPGQLPERALHQLAGADGQHPAQPAAGAAAVPVRAALLRPLDRDHRDQVRVIAARGHARRRVPVVASHGIERVVDPNPLRRCQPFTHSATIPPPPLSALPAMSTGGCLSASVFASRIQSMLLRSMFWLATFGFPNVVA